MTPDTEEGPGLLVCFLGLAFSLAVWSGIWWLIASALDAIH